MYAVIALIVRDGSMHDIARILSVTNIDDNRRHGHSR